MISHNGVGYISSPTTFVTLSFHLCKFFPQLYFWLYFALFSHLFLSFSRLPNTPLEDDNSRDAWLSLKALKRGVDSLVLGLLQVVLMLLMIQVLHLWFQNFQTRV